MIKRWLEKLENANKETFGSEPLDCCKIGRNTSQKKAVTMTSDKHSKKK